MKKKKIVFMGTPDFAVSVLEALIENEFHVVAVVSQPDKPVGRKKELKETAVKSCAKKYNIPILQPVRIKNESELVLSWEPDLIITCAYGQMIPSEILDSPKYGCINVHASLLPKLRGGAPIHKAVMYGETETGITIMKMANKMDAGDIYCQRKEKITIEDTTGTLYDRLKVVASELLIDSLPAILSGEALFVPQDETKVSYAYNVSKEEEFIPFQRPYLEVYNHIRSLIPSPVGFGVLGDKKYKFHKVVWSDDKCEGTDGEVMGLMNDCLAIALEKKLIYIAEIQMEGKQKTSARDFYNGIGKEIIGEIFS